MPTGKLNKIPAPIGIQDEDPLYQILSRYLGGPFLRDYYNWGMEMKNDPSKRDRWKKGDDLSYQAWRKNLRQAMIERRGLEEFPE